MLETIQVMGVYMYLVADHSTNTYLAYEIIKDAIQGINALCRYHAHQLSVEQCCSGDRNYSRINH